MNAFFVTALVNVVNTINFIIQNEYRDNDLYLVPAAAGSPDMAERLKETGLFQSVTLLPDILLTYPLSMRKVFHIAKRRFAVLKMLKGKKYDAIYLNSDGWYQNSIIYAGLKKVNRETEIVLMENALNTYSFSYFEKPWYLRAFINMLGMTVLDGRYIKKTYVYQPEALCAKQPGEILPLPKLDPGSQRLMDSLNIVFSVQQAAQDFIGKRFVIIEQKELMVSSDTKLLWQTISQYLNKEKSIIKAHPRQQNSNLMGMGIDVSKNHSIPWEVLLLQMNLENMTILSVLSSSCLLPKLMMGKEPRVILLYKLLPTNFVQQGSQLSSFVEKVASLYAERSRFFVPENLVELEAYLVALTEEQEDTKR